MRKKLLFLALAIIMAVAVLSVTAWAGFRNDDDVVYSVEGGNIYFNEKIGEITDSDDSVTSVDIPSSIDGVAVTRIGPYAFDNCAGLTDISIPDSVDYIGWYAFSGCSGLTSIVIPDKVEKILGSTFLSCSNLTDVVLPDGLTFIENGAFGFCGKLAKIDIPDSVTAIDSVVFYNCTSLTDVVIPDGVTYIDEQTFSGCENLKRVTIPDGVQSIGDGAFARCTSLAQIEIPDSVTSIGSGAFSGCNLLESIDIGSGNRAYSTRDGVLFTADGKTLILYPAGKTGESYVIPDGVTTIEANAFASCISLTDVVIPDSVTSIGEAAFFYCTGLTDVVIPAGVTKINDEVFRDCTSLTSVVIPDGVKSIGERAFENCLKLTEIVIPDSAAIVESQAFSECDSLEKFVVSEKNTSFVAKDGVLFSADGKKIVAYPGGKASQYEIPDGVKTIGDGCFSGTRNLTNVIIPDSVTSIERNAFLFSGLTSAVLPEGIGCIEDYTFALCRDLAYIYIPASVKTVKQQAFSLCDGLTDVYFSGSERQWNAITVGELNSALSTATVHYNSERPEQKIETGFDDVDAGSYYADAVLWAVDHDITTGIGDGLFDPLGSLDRSQAVTFLWRFKGSPEPETTENPFTDVSPDAWYYKAVLWANENNITNGTNSEGTLFSPAAPVSRGSMITFLWRTMGRPGKTDSGEWYEDAERWAVENDLLNGTEIAYETEGACPRSDVVYYLWEVLK